MRNECNIVRDILPLYAENMVSDDTAAFVKEHLDGCPACRAELEKMREPVQPGPDIDAAPLKQLKRTLRKKKIETILCTAAIVLALVLSGIAFLTTPEYFDYSPELLNVTEGADGEATIHFNYEITNYRLQKVDDPEEQGTVYHLEAWTSAWDRMFDKPGARDISVKPEDDAALIIYLTQYAKFDSPYGSGDGSVCIYGEPSNTNGGWVALPRLSQFYWLCISILAFVILGTAWLILRKRERLRRWIERLLLIPVAYALGYLCVLQFNTISYSGMRDFQLIFAIGVLFYCAMTLALRIFYSRKETRDAQRALQQHTERD